MHLGLKKKKIIIIIRRRKLEYRELFRFAKTALIMLYPFFVIYKRQNFSFILFFINQFIVYSQFISNSMTKIVGK